MTQDLARNHLPTNSVELDQNTLVVNTGKQVVLFDTGTGAGTKAFGPDSGRLIANLRAAGIHPAAIDGVILTHAHRRSLLRPDDARRAHEISRTPKSIWPRTSSISGPTKPRPASTT